MLTATASLVEPFVLEELRTSAMSLPPTLACLVETVGPDLMISRSERADG